MSHFEIVTGMDEKCDFCGKWLYQGTGIKSTNDQGDNHCAEYKCNPTICRECITRAFTLIEEGRGD